VPYLKRYFAEFEKTDAAADGSTQTEADAITAEEYARQRDQYIQSGKGTPPAR
tara:strand:+ start:10762 stop:10920 length:159 start_codon:yes stop_codon:yes gene_type:complete